MNTKAPLASLALFCVLSQSLAQTAPPPSPQSQDKDDVVRIQQPPVLQWVDFETINYVRS